MEKQKFYKTYRRKSKRKRFGWRIPNNKTSSNRIHFSNEINYLNKNGKIVNINKGDESESGTVVGTPSSNNSEIDIIIKKSLETDSYLNDGITNSESYDELSEMSYSSNLEKISQNNDIQQIHKPNSTNMIIDSNNKVIKIQIENRKSKEDTDLINRINAQKHKKILSNKNETNGIIDQKGNGSGLNVKNGLRKVHSVIIKKVPQKESKDNSFNIINERREKKSSRYKIF